MLRTILGLAGLSLLALGSPLAPAAPAQCDAGSDSLCGCSELIERHLIKYIDECTQEPAIAACEDIKCAHDGDSDRPIGFTDIFAQRSGNVERSVGGNSPMCEIPGKWCLNPLCWLLGLGMIIISPLVFAWVGLIYVIALLGDLVCIIGQIFGHPCNGSYTSQVEHMDDNINLLGGVMVGLVGAAVCWYRHCCHARSGKC